MDPDDDSTDELNGDDTAPLAGPGGLPADHPRNDDPADPQEAYDEEEPAASVPDIDDPANDDGTIDEDASADDDLSPV